MTDIINLEYYPDKAILSEVSDYLQEIYNHSYLNIDFKYECAGLV